MNASSDRIEVALFTYDLRGSGVVRNALRIGRALVDAGVRAELWVVRDEGDMRAAVPPYLPVRAIGGPRLSSRFLDGLLAVRGLARLIGSMGPACFFSTGNHAHLPASIAYRLMRRKTSATRFAGRASNALVEAGPLTPLFRLGERFQYRLMQPVIAVSSELGGDLVERLGLPREQVEIVRNGVDVAEVARQAGQPLDHPWFQPGEPPVILGIGRLGRQKNFPLLIEAFAHSRRERPMRLAILGKGGDRHSRRLAAIAAHHGIAKDVALIGFDANPYRYMARAGLYALTSRWEGASNTLIEALACGCPIVATACPTGVREVVTDDVGLVVPQGDARAFADAMLLQLASPPDSERIKARAEAFRLDKMLQNYVVKLRSAY